MGSFIENDFWKGLVAFVETPQKKRKRLKKRGNASTI